MEGARELSKSQSRDKLSELFGEFPTFIKDEIFGEHPCEWMSLNDFECGKELGTGSYGNIYLTCEEIILVLLH